MTFQNEQKVLAVAFFYNLNFFTSGLTEATQTLTSASALKTLSWLST